MQLPNRSALRSVLREPLLHFIVLAAALFRTKCVACAGRQQHQGRDQGERTSVHSLAENFRRTWQRPPTPQELDAMVADYVREDVLVREALALGLDRDDTIVRRRLRQKMEFISEEAAGLLQPTDQELTGYLEAHPDAFRSEAVFTFTQVFIDPAKRGKAADADARQLLAVLRQKNATDVTTLGDRLTLLDSRYEAIAARCDEVIRQELRRCADRAADRTLERTHRLRLWSASGAC